MHDTSQQALLLLLRLQMEIVMMAVTILGVCPGSIASSGLNALQLLCLACMLQKQDVDH